MKCVFISDVNKGWTYKGKDKDVTNLKGLQHNL